MNKSQKAEAEHLIDEVEALRSNLIRLNISVPNYHIATFNLKSCVAHLFHSDAGDPDLDWEILTTHDIKLLQSRTEEYRRAINADADLRHEDSIDAVIDNETTAMFLFLTLQSHSLGLGDCKSHSLGLGDCREFADCIGSSRRKRCKVEADAAREQCLRSFEADSTARKTKLSYRLRRKIFPKDS